ncbi:MAG: isoprenylcysteine carboxylmethyltransferase family protein [Rhodospirillaceae bacterium]|nr:isoprenylcysteine carboxylmethyltransferase family protein [Rhodospirillaceae bacterium]
MDQTTAVPAYGLWGLAVINSAIFVMFAFSFFKPQTKTDWRTFSAFSAFVVALFVEMYGFPLSIYLLSGWLSSKYPGVNFFTHDSGHLIHTLLRMPGDPHFDPFHILSNLLIFGGFLMLSYSWHTLWKAQRAHRLAQTGLYARMRHPQYSAFILIMFGFLLQWPTLVTLAMFPVLVFMYVRLALREENDAQREFGREYEQWAAVTPRFFPKLGRAQQETAG